jgi:hypothetical protein
VLVQVIEIVGWTTGIVVPTATTDTGVAGASVTALPPPAAKVSDSVAPTVELAIRLSVMVPAPQGVPGAPQLTVILLAVVVTVPLGMVVDAPTTVNPPLTAITIGEATLAGTVTVHVTACEGVGLVGVQDFDVPAGRGGVVVPKATAVLPTTVGPPVSVPAMVADCDRVVVVPVGRPAIVSLNVKPVQLAVTDSPRTTVDVPRPVVDVTVAQATGVVDASEIAVKVPALVVMVSVSVPGAVRPGGATVNESEQFTVPAPVMLHVFEPGVKVTAAAWAVRLP